MHLWLASYKRFTGDLPVKERSGWYLPHGLVSGPASVREAVGTGCVGPGIECRISESGLVRKTLLKGLREA